jgi:hypothetical protein
MIRIALLLAAGLLAAAPNAARAQSSGASDAASQGPARAPVKVPEATLRLYVGEYEFEPGRRLIMTLEERVLHGSLDGTEKHALMPTAQDRFDVEPLNIKIVFRKNEAGKVSELVMLRDGSEQILRKMK